MTNQVKTVNRSHSKHAVEQFIKLNLWQRDAQKQGHCRIGHTKKTSEQYEGNIL